jgi:4'-phosphopantetheinyl transferase
MPSLPAARDIHLWQIDLAGEPPPDTEDVLQPSEMLRAGRFAFDVHRHRFLRGRYALRQILGAYVERPARDVPLLVGAHGKPHLDLGQRIEFNLSHSDDFALLAISARSEVGVDVERLRTPRDIRALARSVFSRQENAAFDALPDDALTLPFFTCWTQKEAVLKALGTGLSLDAKSIHVGLDAALKTVAPPPGHGTHSIEVVTVTISNDLAAAVAAQGGIGTIDKRRYAFEESVVKTMPGRQ